MRILLTDHKNVPSVTGLPAILGNKSIWAYYRLSDENQFSVNYPVHVK